MTLSTISPRNALWIAMLQALACSSDSSSTPSATNASDAAGASASKPAMSTAGTNGTTSASTKPASNQTSSAGTNAAPAAMNTPATMKPTAATTPAVAGTTAAAGAAATSAGAPASAGTGGSAAPLMSAACNPADKKPDPTPVPFTQLSGYQSLTKEPTTGPNKPVIETDPGLADWTIYRPETLDEGSHPVLAWAEGGCLKNGTLYGQWLLELASWGYLVVADGPPTKPSDDPAVAGIRQDADGKPQMMAIEFLIAENDRPCSQYYHKVSVDKLAVSGQSCGGLMSLAAAGDKRITTAVIGNSGLFAADQTIYGALHTPIIYLIGGSSDIAYQNAENDYTAIDKVPIFNANMNTGHGGTWNAANGGEFGRVGLAWLNWQLKGDDSAKKMFVGADCELCKPPSMWMVKKKMLDN
jgi:hypothetical protein